MLNPQQKYGFPVPIFTKLTNIRYITIT